MKVDDDERCTKKEGKVFSGHCLPNLSNWSSYSFFSPKIRGKKKKRRHETRRTTEAR